MIGVTEDPKKRMAAKKDHSFGSREETGNTAAQECMERSLNGMGAKKAGSSGGRNQTGNAAAQKCQDRSAQGSKETENEFYIETKDLAVGYDGKTLIGQIGIRVKRGEILTLIGPNGSGKSTILKSIVGQLKRIAGVIFLEGQDMQERSANDIAKRMAILMTERMQPELMTCRDIVSTGRYPYTGKLGLLSREDKAIAQEALAQVDGLSIADRPFDAISDGQRQRILLARALCQQPEIIILDEPTSFLDIRYKLELLSILKKMVREKNLAVILSLHELDLAERISDTVVCVCNDHIDRTGPPSEIFTKEYIAKLYHMEPGRYDRCFDTLEFVP